MTISFTGNCMHDVMTQIKDFLYGEAGETPKVETTPAPVPVPTEPAPAPAAQPHYTAAEVRKAFNEAAQSGVARDALRKALKDISGCDSLSAAPEESYAALIDWCKEAVSHAQ